MLNTLPALPHVTLMINLQTVPTRKLELGLNIYYEVTEPVKGTWKMAGNHLIVTNSYKIYKE